MSAPNAAQTTETATNVQIEALTKKVEELQAKNDELIQVEEDMKKVQEELKHWKTATRQMQRVCGYMTRVATDGTKKRGKGLTGVYQLAEQSVKGCLYQHAVFVAERVWPFVKRMPVHWTTFSEKKPA